jgi:L-alanine-DL-glutamate epimerase-like enolase superfamily enzyme
MKISLKKHILPLKHTFSISRKSVDFQDTLIVGLTLNESTGYGEATSNPYYNITVESMMREIEAVSAIIEMYDFTTPTVFHSFLISNGLSNFAICALDVAAHDLYGKLNNKTLYDLWGTNIQHYPTTNYTIGIAPIDKMVEKIKETPWPIYKIKLGTDDDVGIVKELRKHTDSLFRIDANCAWTATETIRNAPLLKNKAASP